MLRPKAAHIVTPDHVPFLYSPQCPRDWAADGPWAVACLSLGYKLPFWKLPFHFRVPFIFCLLKENMG